jgi:hypothetical protein
MSIQILEAPFDTLGTLAGAEPVGGPVSVAWAESTLTRAKELESLCAWTVKNHPRGNSEVMANAIACHLEAARQAAHVATLKPRWRANMLGRQGALIERSMSNLDAAEAELLNVAPADYVLGQMPCLLRHVQCHLAPNDPRRQEFDRIASRLGVKDPDSKMQQNTKEQRDDRREIVTDERGRIVTAVRGASSAALREQLRVRSFRNIVVATTVFMTLLAIGLAVIGFVRPTLLPLCFAPEEAGQSVVVCPTAQSARFDTSPTASTTSKSGATDPLDVDNYVQQTATPQDLLVVELVGLIAAAVAAAAAIRGIRGSSERYGLPVALAALKLPTGAVTAFLGLLLMRGQFVPGLSALDTSAQILAWALVFGYGQQLFTRLVDQQGQSVLNSVRGADKAPPKATPM